MIPKILNYFWDADRPDPPCVARWRTLLPSDWEIRLWTPDMVENQHRDWLIDKKAWATLADVARLQAMVTVGGVYLDTDMELLTPPDHLLDKAWVCVEGGDTICNAALGSAPGNPFFTEALRWINFYDLPGVVRSGNANVAGPVLLSNLWRQRYGVWPESTVELGHEEADVKILPKRVFYPHSWNEIPCDPSKDTCAIHLWEARWKH